MRTVLFVGGGTAGHVEPALAVAREWRSRYPSDRCIFLGTTEGLEAHLVPAAHFELRTIPKVVPPRRLQPGIFTFPFRLAAAYSATQKHLRDVDLMIGFGGYVSAPAYVAAAVRRIPYVIHEANAKPGWANRLGARFSRYTATAQPVTSTRFVDALITGIPLRSDVQSTLDHTTDWAIARMSAKRELGFPENEKLIVVLGGSQGSVALNQTITQSLGAFAARNINLFHSCGARNTLPEPGYHYRPVHYINEMARAYLAADVIIARSGAITCSEVNALGRYALFIPLPVGNGEQEVNANHLIAQSRAEVIAQSRFTPEWIATNLDRLLERSAASSIEGSYSDHDAARKIANFMEYAWEQGR